MIPPYRVLISVPTDNNLAFFNRPEWLAMKKEIIERVKKEGFEPIIWGETKLPLKDNEDDSWTFKVLDKVMRLCQGAIVLGLPRWIFDLNSGVSDETQRQWIGFITEYSQCEGMLAINQNLPTLLIKDHIVAARGVVSTHAGKYVVTIPPNVDEK